MRNRTLRGGRNGRSLTVRFVTSMLLGEAVFALVLGAVTGVYVAYEESRQRQEHLEQTAGAIAASLIPLVMDKDPAAAAVQLESIRELNPNADIECIRLADGDGNTIADSGSSGEDCCKPVVDAGPLYRFTGRQSVRAPLVVGDVELGAVSMQFAPVGLAQGLGPAILVTMLVMTSVTLVSVPWIVWLVVKVVIEPLDEVREAATALSHGERELDLDDDRRDEIGQLASALTDLARQLEMQEAEIEHALAEERRARTDEAEAKRKIQDLYRVKSDFVAVASHELRSPLAVVRMYSDLLVERNVGGQDAETAEIVSGLRSATSRLTSITADLLDAAMLDRGIMPMVMDHVDMCDLVEAAAEDASRLATARGVVVAVSDVPEGAVVRGDALRIRQVLDNLIGNAVKFSPYEAVVEVRGLANADSIDIEVLDRGPGIQKDQSDRLFTLFGRLDSRDNRKTAGLGLGLAISARIAEAHGGSITWRANVGGLGTVFTLRLPLHMGESPVERVLVQVIDHQEAQ